MNGNLDSTVSDSIDLKDAGFQRPRACDDPYYTRGRDFPMPDSDKGVESGPQETVDQSEKQKAPRLNASRGKYGPSIKGAEGAAFPTTANGQESSDESPTFAGDRDVTVSLNLTSGQIESVANTRTVNGKKLRDVKANRV